MVKEVFLDFETRSRLDIRKVGGARYCTDCSVLLLAYAFDDEPVQLLDMHQGDKLPADLLEALTDPNVLKIAQNVPFERRVFKYALGIDIPIEQWRDLKAKALSLALPESLDGISNVIAEFT